MIAPARSILSACPKQTQPAWHEPFLVMLPKIRQQAETAFARLSVEAREEAVAEVVANSVVAFCRLVQADKSDLAYPTVLARYGIAQFYDGRRVGSRCRISEMLCPAAQRKRGFRVERLDRFERVDGRWREAVVEDRRTPVPDQAAFRVDFPDWLATLAKRNRRIAETLALGHSAGHVARSFDLSSARVSQLRTELRRLWRDFHGERSGVDG